METTLDKFGRIVIPKKIRDDFNLGAGMQILIETFTKIVSLTPSEYISTIKSMSELGLSGGITYDALIAKVAQKSKVERLLTININYFKRVWPEGKKAIIEP